MPSLGERLDGHLAVLYPQLGADERRQLGLRIALAAEIDDTSPAATAELPGADEVALITYGDSFVDRERPGLQVLAEVLDDHLGGLFSTVHVLPFFPSSSDGGFSITDYRGVAPALGDWHDIERLAASHHLMVDLVANHGSRRSEWFRQFVEGREPGRRYFLTVEPDTDLSAVVRPRTHELLVEVETTTGPRHVWATFSDDQIDFDFREPDVLVEFCGILGDYLTRGADRIRLDAIAYAWKRIGTSCIHLSETHELVRLFRAVANARNPRALIVTETNVPHIDNVSYFGAGDEAHMVYNFTLAPLIVSAVLSEDATALTSWLDALEPPPAGCCFLNFLASHDGIGLRPVEDLVDPAEIDSLLREAAATGGSHSSYATADGPRPYELNVSLADLLAGLDGTQWRRFVVAHAVMLAVAGVPAFYVHSIFVSPGDPAAAIASGHRRDINRGQIEVGELPHRLGTGWRAEAHRALRQLIEARRSTGAFDPAAAQAIHELHPCVAAIERGVGHDRVLAVHNLSDHAVEVALPSRGFDRDLLDPSFAPAGGQRLELGAWQARWLELS